MVAMPAAVDGDVFHRQWPRAAVLHRAVFATRLRELHAGRCDTADATRNLDRTGLSRFPSRTHLGATTGSVCKLRPALEFVSSLCDLTECSREARNDDA